MRRATVTARAEEDIQYPPMELYFPQPTVIHIDPELAKWANEQPGGLSRFINGLIHDARDQSHGSAFETSAEEDEYRRAAREVMAGRNLDEVAKEAQQEYVAGLCEEWP